jgi:DNA-binding transcriptional regulator YiaG
MTQRIRQIRNALKLTQANFAVIISVSKGYVADLEIGAARSTAGSSNWSVPPSM